MPVLTADQAICALVRSTHRVAVLGIKPETHARQPASYVPAYLMAAGLDVIPVPVYFPELDAMYGQTVYRRVADIPGTVDLVDVFRRPQDLSVHLDDILAAKPRAVWLQSGIRDDAFARALSEAGIDVVQDRCLMVEHRRWRV